MKIISWCPKDPDGNPIPAGAIKVEPGTLIDKQMFMMILADRIQGLLQTANEKDLIETAEVMQERGVLSGTVETLTKENSRSILVENNPFLYDAMGMMGVWDNLPVTPTKNSAEAEEILTPDETEGIGNWLSSLHP